MLASEDYYFNEDGLMVFTREYHLKRGFCCKNNCLNCPYTDLPTEEKQNSDPDGQKPR